MIDNPIDRCRSLCLRLLLLFVGVAGALLLAEGWLRLTARYEGLGCARELRQFRGDEAYARYFCLDPEFGFRPELGTELYNVYGTVTNAYAPACPPGVRRVLFIGDSVTFRGAVIRALRRRYGETDYEYWNAGVESFNTVQEAAFYERYNRRIEPDQVVLTFHLNDFETTPVAFRDGDGRMVVYAPNMPVRELHPWWFRHSRLYRLLAGAFKRSDASIDAVMAETDRALRALKGLAAGQGAGFSVVVMPFLEPHARWSSGDQFAHRAVLAMLDRLDIRHFDLLPVSEQALAAGIDMCETPDDSWHPSAAGAERFAAFLWEQGLLE